MLFSANLLLRFEIKSISSRRSTNGRLCERLLLAVVDFNLTLQEAAAYRQSPPRSLHRRHYAAWYLKHPRYVQVIRDRSGCQNSQQLQNHMAACQLRCRALF